MATMAKNRFNTDTGPPTQRQLRVGGELIRRTLSDLLMRGARFMMTRSTV